VRTVNERSRSTDPRALAGAFARAYPAIADRLAEQGTDPDVARLVDGFEYLTARVERVLDATSARAATHFAELLAPEILRPFPSATVLELSPPAGARGRVRVEVPPGAEFDSVDVGGARCRFRANSAFAIVPWRVDAVRAGWDAERGASLAVTLVAAELPAPIAVQSLFPLRLHVSGEPHAASAVLFFLQQHLEDVELDLGTGARSLGKASLRPWGLATDEALLPREPLEHPGIRLLREAMILPAKLAFVTVDPGSVNLEERAERVVLRFRFDAPLPLGVSVTRDHVRVNCVPVINAFEATAEPFRPSLERPSEVLRAAGIAPHHGGIYAVRAVTARLQDGRSVPVARLEDWGAAAGPHLEGAFYTLTHARAFARAERGAEVESAGTDIELALGAPADGTNLPPIGVVSVDVWATNGARPASLGIGDVRLAAPASPPGVTFRNIVAVTPHRAAPSGSELTWRTLASCALSARSLAHHDALRALIHVLNLHPLGDAQAARAHAQRVAAILEVAATPAHDVLGGTRVRGHDVALRLQGGGFDGEGDAFLYASVLSRLFAHEASVNAFVRLTVTLAETGKTFRFPALHADRRLDDRHVP
jgi:type VI secretion system protein ImpG